MPLIAASSYALGWIRTEGRCEREAWESEIRLRQNYVKLLTESERQRDEARTELRSVSEELEVARELPDRLDRECEQLTAQRNLINARYQESLKRLFAIRESLDDLS